MAIGPRGLDGNAPKMRVPGLGNPAAPRSGARGGLAGPHPAVAHQLRRPREAGERADFGDNRHRRHECDPAQRLEGVDHRALRRRARLHRLIDRALESRDAVDRMIDFVHVVQARRLLGRVRELHLPDPRQIPWLHAVIAVGRRRPCRSRNFPSRWRARNWSFLAASRARTKSRSASWAASGHPHRRQSLARWHRANFAASRRSVLTLFPRFRGHQRRRDHLTRHAQGGQLPIDHIPSRPGFVAHPQRLGGPQFLDQLPDRLGGSARRPACQPSPRFGNGNGNRFRMDIRPDKIVPCS